VIFKKGMTGISRSRFEILFKNENGKLKKRLIMLPGSLSSGDKHTVTALEIMKDAGLL